MKQEDYKLFLQMIEQATWPGKEAEEVIALKQRVRSMIREEEPKE